MFENRTVRRSRRGTRLVAVPLGVVAVLGLAACGTGTSAASTGTSASATDAAPSTTAGRSDSAMTAFRTCMAQNGVTLPERPSNGGGKPAGGDGAGTPPSGAPEPPAGDGSGGAAGTGSRHGGARDQAPPGVDATTWAAARKACADLAPARPSHAASSSSGT